MVWPRLGVSPRGLLLWLRVARAWAALRGRPFVAPGNVQAVALPVFEVRLVLDRIDAATLVTQVLERVPVPA